MSPTAVLEQKSARQCVRELGIFLADTYILYLKSQNFHWNVVDPRFHSLHEFFEDQYKELAEAVDLIAERIRALGERSPATMREFLELTRLQEPSQHHLTGDEMLKNLLKDHESIIQWLRPAIDQTNAIDSGTGDLLIERLRVHEKSAWMIRSHFKGG